jgi:hypothetical protein
MIETYKILTNKYDKSVTPQLALSKIGNTRGHNLKLEVLRSKNDIRKFSFSVRVPPVWNSLTNKVINSSSVNNFKNNLDNFWANQEILYNYDAPLSRTRTE